MASWTHSRSLLQLTSYTKSYLWFVCYIQGFAIAGSSTHFIEFFCTGCSFWCNQNQNQFVSCPMIKLWIFCWLDECVRLYGKTKGTPTHYKYKSCSAIEMLQHLLSQQKIGNFYTLCTSTLSNHSITLYSLPLWGWVAAIPKCFHFAITSPTVPPQLIISRREDLD